MGKPEKEKNKYTLKVFFDNWPFNPRQECENLGKMACWHSRYNLGDKCDYSEPTELLHDLIIQTIPEKDIIAYAKRKGKESDGIVDDVLNDMGVYDLISLAQTTHLISLLYFYDHSIQSISTVPFYGRALHAEWDSGVVGFIYVSHADILKEYGDNLAKSIEKAQARLNSEVKTYDDYMRGECYSFQLFKNGLEEDRCGGFGGDFDEIKEDIRACLPKEAAYLIDSMKYSDVNNERM